MKVIWAIALLICVFWICRLQSDCCLWEACVWVRSPGRALVCCSQREMKISQPKAWAGLNCVPVAVWKMELFESQVTGLCFYRPSSCSHLARTTACPPEKTKNNVRTVCSCSNYQEDLTVSEFSYSGTLTITRSHTNTEVLGAQASGAAQGGLKLTPKEKWTGPKKGEVRMKTSN